MALTTVFRIVNDSITDSRKLLKILNLLLRGSLDELKKGDKSKAISEVQSMNLMILVHSIIMKKVLR